VVGKTEDSDGGVGPSHDVCCRELAEPGRLGALPSSPRIAVMVIPVGWLPRR